MIDPHDKDATKVARSMFSRHGIDISMADLRVNHGICYLRGTVQAMRGANYEDVRIETERVARLLKQKPEIRDVVLDAVYRG